MYGGRALEMMSHMRICPLPAETAYGEREMGIRELTSGAFVVSLDLELFWGVRDQGTLADFGSIILRSRNAIPVLLDVFASFQISATWAVVGMLFCGDKEEMLSCLPSVTPEYQDRRFCPYAGIAAIGRNEKEDPYHFGQSLVKRIGAYENQEIGSHTFSHFYCMESGCTLHSFRADLEAARAIARRSGVDLKSIAFPRNQMTPSHLRIASQLGFKAFRGNPRIFFYRSSREAEQTYVKRAARLVDTYVPIAGHQVYRPAIVEGMVDLVGSRFLRSSRGRALHVLQATRIRAGMMRAAKSKKVFHLWWHPQDFGHDPELSLELLNQVLAYYVQLHEEFGMQSFNMHSLVETLRRSPSPEPLSYDDTDLQRRSA